LHVLIIGLLLFVIRLLLHKTKEKKTKVKKGEEKTKY